MDQFIEFLTRYSNKKTASQIRAVAITLLLAGAALTTACYFVVTVPVLPSILGAISGVTWFSALFFIWSRLLPTKLHDQLNWRGTLVPARRRVRIAWVVLAWVAAIILAGSYIPGPVLGTLNVAAALVFWRVATASPAERALSLAEDTLPTLPAEENEDSL